MHKQCYFLRRYFIVHKTFIFLHFFFYGTVIKKFHHKLLIAHKTVINNVMIMWVDHIFRYFINSRNLGRPKLWTITQLLKYLICVLYWMYIAGIKSDTHLRCEFDTKEFIIYHITRNRIAEYICTQCKWIFSGNSDQIKFKHSCLDEK